MDTTNTINLQQAQQLIPNKAALYNACLFNNYRLPEAKTSLCSKEFLLAVKDHRCYTPRLQNVLLRACANPPPVAVLHEYLIATIENNFGEMTDESFGGFAELLRLLEKGKADKKWYLDVIATLTMGQHELFSPNYLYTKKTMSSDLTIQNNSGFFDHLPRQSNIKGNGSVLMTDAQRDACAMKRLEKQQLQLNLRMKKQQEKKRKIQEHEAKVFAQFEARQREMRAKRSAADVIQREHAMQAEVSQQASISLGPSSSAVNQRTGQSRPRSTNGKISQDVKMNEANVIGNKAE